MNRAVLMGAMILMGAAVFGQPDYERLRMEMVEKQLMARDITDSATLRAMRIVERHKFVPQIARPYAYIDSPLSIGKGQTISQPYMVAFMTQELSLKPGDKVLEIGTGSGYQAAVLAEIGAQVYTIEIVESLGKQAEKCLKAEDYANVSVRIGDGYHGWPEEAPFDAIIVTAGVEEIPEPLLVQLKEGGRMVIPVGKKRSTRQLVLVTKNNGKIKKRNRLPVVFVEFQRAKN